MEVEEEGEEEREGGEGETISLKEDGIVPTLSPIGKLFKQNSFFSGSLASKLRVIVVCADNLSVNVTRARIFYLSSLLGHCL